MDNDPPQMHLVSRYALLVFIWSTTPLAVVLSIRELHPIWALALRFALATPFATLCLWLCKAPLPLTKAAFVSYSVGMLSLFGAMIFTYLGAVYLPSSLISLLFGLAPLFVGMLAHGVFKTQKLGVNQWAGLILALLGLWMIFAHDEQHGTQHYALGIVLTLLGVFCYVASVFLLKKQTIVLHPLAQTTGSLLLSSVAMLCVLPFYWSFRPTQMPSVVTITALLYSVVMASVVAMFCYFYLVKQLAPATISLTTLLTPMFALLWGYCFNDERFNGDTAWGMLSIMLGLLAYFAKDIKLYFNPAEAVSPESKSAL
ncbi:DMT family transporter [Agitococcus lubricus]|uniref:Drug/metabolite transporter (DMT)-like permease n=1 Tax=Agitococcus lubricus TaxID=1077255 RepID=A0A2T5J449_9GAMM|nr:DMT family transporter [Agitococcus lubricus]PTQ91389.1 drug/metabolite transporter (DMT)-like permease [Agitococcus lubricus]